MNFASLTRGTLWSAFTVRQSITAAVAVVTALAMVGAGFTVYFVEIRRIDRVIERQIAQELGEFDAKTREDVDPDTRRPYSSVDRLLVDFLKTNLADDDELLFGFLSSGWPPKVQGQPDAVLERSPEFMAAVERLMVDGGTTTLTAENNRYILAVQPVSDGANQAAFVLTHNVSAARSELRNLVRTYAAVAALSLLVVIGVAGLLSGRLLRPCAGSARPPSRSLPATSPNASVSPVTTT